MSLQKDFLNKDVYDTFINNVSRAEDQINASLGLLKENRVTIPAKIEKVTPEWFKDFITKAEKKACEATWFPNNVLAEMKKGYQKTLNDCLPLCSDIQRLYSLYPFKYTLNDGGFDFDESVVKQAAIQAATHEFTADEKEYYGFLEALAELKTKIRNFETSKGYNVTVRQSENITKRGISLSSLLEDDENGDFKAPSPETFLRAINLGNILVNVQQYNARLTLQQ